jgi:flagellin-like hook-associated protein FlgL
MLATHVDDLLRQVVSLSQTQASGRYIFSGDADLLPSYQYNPTSDTRIDRMQVSPSTSQVEDVNGNRFSVSLSANQIFDDRDATDQPTGNNVFEALNNLRVALETDDTAAIGTGINAVKDASGYLNQQESFYGNVLNRVGNAIDDAATASVAFQQDLSNRQDADATADIVQMQQYLTDLQAAMMVQSKMPQGSMFDLMK